MFHINSFSFTFIQKSFFFAWITCFTLASCQTDAQEIKPTEIKKIITVLASDDMNGRKAGTPDARKAANYIADQFKEIGLTSFNEQEGYLQEFTLHKIKATAIQTKLNNRKIESEHLFFYSGSAKSSIQSTDKINVIPIEQDAEFFQYVLGYNKITENTLYLVDRSWKDQFQRAKRLMDQDKFVSGDKMSQAVIVWALTDLKELNSVSVETNSTITETKLANVVGMLPGKSKKDEYVIYSGHYDHLGIIKGTAEDSIANGADDDASGVTAVITLANHFKNLDMNERTLLFVCFTAEEIGLFGSEFFTTQINADQVVAGINIEMIGKVSKFGKKEAFLTGFERSDLGEILNKSLLGSSYKIQPDPYTKYRLFYRSDNASLARKGVPAHTISTSQIDSDKYYHAVGDEVKTLNINNMTETIKLIAKSTESIIKGEATPTRIEKVE